MPLKSAEIVLEAADDVAGLARQIETWGASRVARLAILARIEGEYEDGSRERARAAVFGLLGRHELAEKCEMVTVVGCEGLVTPFLSVMAEVENGTAGQVSNHKRLAIGIAHGTPPADADLDRASFKAEIARIVGRAMADARLAAGDVSCVLINTPQPATGDKASRGRKARALAALAGGIAIGEIEDGAVTDAALVANANLFTKRVQTFTGPTVKQVEVIVIGNRAGAGGDLVAVGTCGGDLMDLRPMKRMLVGAGLALDADGELIGRERVASLILKSGVPADGRIKGRPTTLFRPGLAVEKHVRGAQSGLVAGLLGTTCAFATFDPVQQCSPGGFTACAIVRAV